MPSTKRALKALIPFCLIASAFGQYKMESAGAPPSELAPAIAAALQPAGTKIVSAAGAVVCEVWFRTTMPSGPKSSEDNTTLVTVPHGALLGAIRFPAQGQDRRGQPIKPGVYTLRFSLFPVNGDHQGVAPQRDFLLLSPAKIDQDLNATPAFDPLMDMSRKASGTPHPATLSFWKSEANSQPSFTKVGDNDWVLETKIGDTPVAVILVGKTDA